MGLEESCNECLAKSSWKAIQQEGVGVQERESKLLLTQECQPNHHTLPPKNFPPDGRTHVGRRPCGRTRALSSEPARLPCLSAGLTFAFSLACFPGHRIDPSW